MNRNCIATHASALPGVDASVRKCERMAQGLGGFTRTPGEGDMASP